MKHISLNYKKKGFTLLELLISIAIIGILVSIGVASYAAAQKKARDSKRRADLKAVQSAFEQYYAQSATQEYPASCTIDATYMPSGIPTDPKTGDSYGRTCVTTGYCFCGLMESAGSGNSDDNCTFAAPRNYYCVKELQ